MPISPLHIKSEPACNKLPAPIRCAIDAALDKKAFDIVVLDLQGSGAFTDYFLLCSAQSTRQVKAIADEIEEQLCKTKSQPSHVEGYKHAEWVLMDYFDFVVHVFTRDNRRFYDLERLWGNAQRFEVQAPA